MRGNLVILALFCLAGCRTDSIPVGPLTYESIQRLAEPIEVAPPANHAPLAVTAAVRPSPTQAGSRVHFVVKVDMAEGWHIYSLQNSGPGIATTLELAPSDSFAPVGDWILPPASKDVTGSNDVYEGSFVFGRELVLDPDTARGEVTVSCQLGYQACDLEICWPPRTVELTAVVSVVNE